MYYAFLFLRAVACCVRDPGWPHASSQGTSLDLSRFDGADDLSGFPTGHKRSMSWLLAAVMSVCEEDPRKCRAMGRGRQRIRSADGEYIVVDTDDGTLSTPITDDAEVLKQDDEVLKHDDEVLKRSADDSRGLEILPVIGDGLTVRCRTENC